MHKLNRIHIIIAVFILIISISAAVFTLKDKKEDSRTAGLDIEKLYMVSVYGTDGEGYIDLELNHEYLKSIMDISGIELTPEIVRADLSAENNLSNGDCITISFKDKDAIMSMGVNISVSDMSYTVSALKEGTDIDVFNDIEVYIEQGKVFIDTGQCSNFVKDNVEFFIKNQLETYKEGDTITVGAYIDMNAATDNGYNIDITEKEIIISE